MAEEKYSFVEVSPTPISESEFLDQSLEATNDWFVKIGSCIREDEKKDFSSVTETLSPEDKQRILSGVKPAMDEVATELGIILPDDLLNRVYILNRPNFYRFTKPETGGRNPQGITLSNRYVLLDYQSLQRTAKRTGEDFETLLRMSVIHELWHSTDYMANWVKAGKILRDSAPKKVGMWVGVPDFEQTRASVGLYLLNEGFTQFRTEETQKKMGEACKYEPYPAEVEIVRLLKDNIGIKPFVKTATTKNGLKDFSEAMTLRYGVSSLKTVLLKLDDDRMNQSTFGRPSYTGTWNFLSGPTLKTA